MSESSAESVPSTILWDMTRYVVVAVIAGGLIWYHGFYAPPRYVHRETTNKTMGTDYIVKIAQYPENADWQKMETAIKDRLDTLDQMMSTYRQDSEVCRFNAFTSTEEWFPVSQETAQVVEVSLEISRLTEGAFDITVFPLVQLWGFGANKSLRQGKSYEELKTASLLLKEQIGYEKLSVRQDPPALKKSIPELAIDLSAIAKGFAVDSIAELLDQQKVSDYLIEIGGEVRSKGKKSKDKNWIVGIEKPTAEHTGNQQRFELKNQCLATSGSYLQIFQVGGHRVSHFIDPRSSMPVAIGDDLNELVSVAVMDTNCARADAWATAMFVLGKQKGLELANQRGMAVLFLLRTSDEIHEVSSNNWLK